MVQTVFGVFWAAQQQPKQQHIRREASCGGNCDEPSIIHAFQCAIATAAVAVAVTSDIAAFAVSIINIKIRFLWRIELFFLRFYAVACPPHDPLVSHATHFSMYLWPSIFCAPAFSHKYGISSRALQRDIAFYVCVRLSLCVLSSTLSIHMLAISCSTVVAEKTPRKWEQTKLWK